VWFAFRLLDVQSANSTLKCGVPQKLTVFGAQRNKVSLGFAMHFDKIKTSKCIIIFGHLECVQELKNQKKFLTLRRNLISSF